MRKVMLGVLAIALALMLSSCFMLQGFSVLANSVKPGHATKAQFVLRPASTSANKAFQFVVVGVSTPADVAIGKTTWGVNHTFGGPVTLHSIGTFVSAMTTAGTCSVNGLDFGSITGMTWKAYMTQHAVGDKGKVDVKSITQTVLNAKAGASSGDGVAVIGVTGAWQDAGSDGPTGDDTFLCTGIATSVLNIT